jgi:hypothetical protein
MDRIKLTPGDIFPWAQASETQGLRKLKQDHPGSIKAVERKVRESGGTIGLFYKAYILRGIKASNP